MTLEEFNEAKKKWLRVLIKDWFNIENNDEDAKIEAYLNSFCIHSFRDETIAHDYGRNR